MKHIKLYESFLNEGLSVPKTLYHGTSKLLKEKMEETKTLFATLGYIGYGFYVTPKKDEAEYWAKNYYWASRDGQYVSTLRDLSDEKAKSKEYRDKIVPIDILTIKIKDAKIYDLGTFYGGGSFLSPKPIGSKKFFALTDEIKKLYPKKDYRIAITEYLREKGYDAIYSKSEYFNSGGEQLCIINDAILLDGYKIVEDKSTKGVENEYGKKKEKMLLKNFK